MKYKITFQKEGEKRPENKVIEASGLVDVYHKLEKEKLGIIKEIKEV